MARRSLEPPAQRSLLSQSVSLGLPAIVCAAGAVLAAQEVFPKQPGLGGLLLGLFAAAFAAAMFARRLAPREILREVQDSAVTDVVDRDTGLGNARQLREVLTREIARCQRFGDRSFLAIAELQVFGFSPLQEGELPPSHGKFAASVLLRQLRATDTVLRLDETHFALLLNECDEAGAEILVDRLRTRLASEPFARNHDGSGIYLRAWLGGTPWDAAMTTPDQYLRAASAGMVASRRGYEAAQQWFKADPAARRAS